MQGTQKNGKIGKIKNRMSKKRDYETIYSWKKEGNKVE